MKIIEGTNVDLISPFPSQEIKRAYGWNHCYRTLTETDDSPNTMEDFSLHMANLLEVCPSWGIIDKNHLTNIRHEAPMVGIIIFEPVNLRHGYFHCATARRAWKTGLIDEAGKIVIGELFNSIPTLLRVGAYMSDKNYPAKGLCKRMGFKLEGICEDMVQKNNVPENIVYFGLTKRSWNLCQQQSQSPLSQVLEEPQSVLLVEEDPSNPSNNPTIV